VKELCNEVNLHESQIDIKKKFTYKNGVRSNVLIIYALVSKANMID